MAEKKQRLDILLVEKGIITSREKAKACIMAGMVFVDGQRVDKAGEKVSMEYKIKAFRKKAKRRNGNISNIRNCDPR
jgi:23S rRNA (cytidine1920-2'-O)/16S rRNA (cytidine1409-2'-O)-methyltransferase